MSDVARKKKRQYVDGAINILAIDSSSDSMVPPEAMARTVGRNSRNVGFEMTWYALPNPQISWKLIEGLKSIGQG